MAGDTAFKEFTDKLENDLEMSQKLIPEYIVWFKFDPNESVWPEGCTHSMTFRKQPVHYELNVQTGA